MVEPGRSIAGPAALTLYRVGTIKEIPGVRTYVAVDGGMSDNPRPGDSTARYEAFLPAAIGERGRSSSRSPASTASRATSSCATPASPTTSQSATCSPCRSPAPTALDGVELQQGAPAGRWCSCATAARGSSSAARR